VLGPVTGDHFYVYVADQCVRPSYECHDRVLNIMMFDMVRPSLPTFLPPSLPSVLVPHRRVPHVAIRIPRAH